MLPAIHADVFYTSGGSAYLKSPGVVMCSKTHTDLEGVQPFLDGFAPELGFGDYLQDPVKLEDGDRVCKFAGQLCYMAFAPGRTWNKDANKYFENIMSSGHGSLLEHAYFGFLWYGISRACTHELVRHRAGVGYSQLSQRYVDGKKLRFCERLEYQSDSELHDMFELSIDSASDEYEARAARLMVLQGGGSELLSGEKKTDLRKKVNQAARACLPNETEAPIFITVNARALRHMLEMRASKPAEIEIRRAAFQTYLCVKEVAPLLFADYVVEDLPDGTKGVSTQYRKV